MPIEGLGHPPTVGVWEMKATLGSGAFGKVVLWQNSQTTEEIAIKTLTKECHGETLRRWENEMRMVKELHHINIVSYVAIPEELQREYPAHISLGMEYCCIGDLRKFMARPEFCCGVEEIHVKDMLSDVGSALYYIHEKHNMHRDLKPENIVLKPRNGFPNRFQFKITDLGYAKNLDLDVSYGLSFVGTWHYLSPEFSTTSNLRYYAPVDFWSFGMVAFECITGYRPFFSNMAPVHILALVKQKQDMHIHGWTSKDGDPPKWVDHIPPPHSLNPHLARELTRWLQLMLRVDGNRRGGKDGEWYKMLCEIIPQKYIEVLNTSNGKIMTIPVTESTNVNAIKKKIYDEASIPISEQLLLLSNHENPRENVGLLEQIRSSNASETNTIFLCTTHTTARNSPIYSIPKEIEQRRSNSRMQIEYTDYEQKRTSKIALHFILENLRLALLFLQGISALQSNVFKLRANLEKRLKNFREEHYRLEGRIQFSTETLASDSKEFQDHQNMEGSGLAKHKFKVLCEEMSYLAKDCSTRISGNPQFIQDTEGVLSDVAILTLCPSFKTNVEKLFEEMLNLRKTAIEKYNSNRREVQKREMKLTRDPSTDKAREHENVLKTFRRESLIDFIRDYVYQTAKYLDNVFADKFFVPMRMLLDHRKKIWEKLMEIDRRSYELTPILQGLREKQAERQHSIWLMLRILKEYNNLANDYDITPSELDQDQLNLDRTFTKMTETIQIMTQDEDFARILDFKPKESMSRHDSGHQSCLEISSSSTTLNCSNHKENGV